MILIARVGTKPPSIFKYLKHKCLTTINVRITEVICYLLFVVQTRKIMIPDLLYFIFIQMSFTLFNS